MQEELSWTNEKNRAKLIGETHQGCTFLRVLSHGGFSTVYEVLYSGRSSKKGIRAAKVYFLEYQEKKKGRQFRSFLEQHIHTEVEIISQFKDYSLPKLYKCFSLSRMDNGRKVVEMTVLIMRLYKAPTLNTLLSQHEIALTCDAVLNVLIRLVTTVKKLHGKKILHRDIKPENIIVETDESGNLMPIVIDFGLSVRIGKDDWLLKCDAGTPEFKAPEISAKQCYSYAVDIFALGVTASKLKDHLKLQFSSLRSPRSVRDAIFLNNTLREFISKATKENANERATLEELSALLASHSSSLQ